MNFSLNLFALFSLICSVSCSLLPKTVDSLQVDAFAGRWYQMYASLIPNVTFEKNGFCVVADYSLNFSESNILKMNVFNSQRLDSPSGELHTMNATITNPSFDKSPGTFLLSGMYPYWILALGDLDATQGSAAQYPWAIISNPLRSMLFILARDTSTFETQYEAEVMLAAANRGFIFKINKPMKTFQSSTECVYPPEPAAIAPTKKTV